jgi:hypothetical protein
MVADGEGLGERSASSPFSTSIVRGIEGGESVGLLHSQHRLCRDQEALMPAPTTREELLRLVREGRAQLEADIARFSEVEMLAAEPGRWSMKDLLAHIAAWDRRTCDLFAAASRGEAPAERISGGDDVDRFNAAAHERNRDLPLPAVRAEFKAAFDDSMVWIDRMPDDLLFDPARVPWNGGHALAWNVAANTYWHYEEHEDRLARKR